MQIICLIRADRIFLQYFIAYLKGRVNMECVLWNVAFNFSHAFEREVENNSGLNADPILSSPSSLFYSIIAQVSLARIQPLEKNLGDFSIFFAEIAWG